MTAEKLLKENVMSNKNLSGSLIKGFMVIELLSDFQEMTLAELSKGLELNKSSVYRLLSTLIELGYVDVALAGVRTVDGIRRCGKIARVRLANK